MSPTGELDSLTTSATLADEELERLFPFRPEPKTHRLYWTLQFKKLRMPPESENEPQIESQTIQGEHTKAYLGKKHQNSVGMQVLVEPKTRDGINALAAVRDVSAKDYVADILKKEVEKNDFLVQQGRRILAERKKRPYRSRFQELAEENARLREAIRSK